MLQHGDGKDIIFNYFKRTSGGPGSPEVGFKVLINKIYRINSRKSLGTWISREEGMRLVSVLK